MKLVIKIAKAGSMTIAGDEYVCQGFPDTVINRLNAECNQFRNEGNSSALGFVLYWTPCCSSANIGVAAETHRKLMTEQIHLSSSPPSAGVYNICPWITGVGFLIKGRHFKVL